MSDIYQQITDRIIAELEKGKIPWHCPWRPREWRHRNLVSKKEYRGINCPANRTHANAKPLA